MKTLLLILLFPYMCYGAATTWYLDTLNGNNSNSGTTVGQPKRTAASILRTNMASGDICYVSPAAPIRESVTLLQQWSATTKFIGDYNNVQGFTNAGGVRVPPGIVRWTTFTNDFVAPIAGNCLSFAGFDDLWLEGIAFFGGGSATIIATTGTSTNLMITNCFIGSTRGSDGITATVGFGVTANVTIVGSYIFASGGALTLTLTSGTGSDYNAGYILKNNILSSMNGGTVIGISKSGSLANQGGGVVITNCSIIGGGFGIATTSTSTNNQTNFVTGCYIFASPGISGNHVSQIVEDYNLISGATPLSIITVGSHTQTNNYSWHADFNISQLFGLGRRPFAAPFDDSTFVTNSGNFLPTDIFRLARPNPNSRGAIEVWKNPETSSSFAQ